MTMPPIPCAASEQSITALNCGIPTPATFLVIQAEPPPIPTLTISAPDNISCSVISGVQTFPAMIIFSSNSKRTFLMNSENCSVYPLATSMHI